MNLANVMQQLADRLNTIEDLRAYGHPLDGATAPAAAVGWPERYEYDGSYQRGTDLIEDLPVVVLVDRTPVEAARDLLAAYADGTGERSVKQVLETGAYTAFDTVRVGSVEFDVVRIGDTDYWAALFRLEISGKGTR